MKRELAADQGISWNEYWEFLGDFANFRTERGLQKLEVFLKDKYKKVNLRFMLSISYVWLLPEGGTSILCGNISVTSNRYKTCCSSIRRVCVFEAEFNAYNFKADLHKSFLSFSSCKSVGKLPQKN